MSRADQRQWSAGAAGPSLRLVPDANWPGRGACRDADPSLFFPEKGQGTRRARAICARCPVRQSCLAYALETGGQWGIWGGELFEAGRVVPRPAPMSRAGSEITAECRNEHKRTKANTHVDAEGRVRCLDCERERCRDRRQQGRLQRERSRERERLRQQRIVAQRIRRRKVAA